MKVLSMIQPWASLFVLGEAKYETRTWKTNYRGPLAIHSSKKIDKKACQERFVQSLLYKHNLTVDTLPNGLIIAKCRLENCLKVIEDNQTWAVLEEGRIVNKTDYFLGDYRVGGYAWEVTNMKILDPFIVAKGRLGLWDYEL